MKEWLKVVGDRLHVVDGLEKEFGHLTYENVESISDVSKRGKFRLILSTLELNRYLYSQLIKLQN